MEVGWLVGTGEAALRRFALGLPNVFLVSLFLPDVSGVEVIRRAREHWPEAAPILMLPKQELHPRQCIEVLEAGARGYFSKGSNAVELIEMIRAVLAGQPVLGPQLTKVVVDYFRARGSVISALTQRERQVLNCSMRDLSQQQAALELGISRATVERHVHNLLRKLNVRSSNGGIGSYLNPAPPW
jgi:DNA-binding NarL/FixJ family response regulator